MTPTPSKQTRARWTTLLPICAAGAAGVAAVRQRVSATDPGHWKRHIVHVTHHAITGSVEAPGFQVQSYYAKAPSVGGPLAGGSIVFFLLGCALVVTLLTLLLRRREAVHTQRVSSSKAAVVASLALFLFAADAVTKTMVAAHTGPGAMSWSLFLGQPMEIVATAICLFAVALSAYAVGGYCAWAGLACVLAGGAGNFYSELCYRGYVPDFITWSTHSFFITVNTADLTIALGLLLALGALTTRALRSSRDASAVALPIAVGAA